MVSLQRRFTTSAVFKRKSSSSNKEWDAKENYPASKRNIDEILAQTSDESVDESIGNSGENKPLDHDEKNANSSKYKPLNRRLGLVRQSSTHGPFKIPRSIRDLVKRRTSSMVSRSCSASGRVSFLDEELGLTPRYVVTDTYLRPRTSNEEKKSMFYSARDFTLFEREHMYEKVEAEIKAIEMQCKRDQNIIYNDETTEIEELDKEPMDLEQVQKLVRNVRNRLNLEQYEKEDDAI